MPNIIENTSIKEGYNMCKINPMKNALFVQRSIAKHGDKYNYDLTDFDKSKVKVTITCPTHGDFQLYPGDHLNGQGCKPCGILRMKAAKSDGRSGFIEKAIKKHGNKYNYDKVVYKGALEHVIITCPTHGDFSMLPSNHTQGYVCPSCSIEHRKGKYAGLFIKRAREIHGDKYDYSAVNYQDAKSKVVLTCPKHGTFDITPDGHLAGNGCTQCGIELNTARMTSTKEEFVEKALKVHGDYYSYDKVEYVNALTAVTITCPLHGDFEQLPSRHLAGHPCGECHEDKQATIKRYVYVLLLNDDKGRFIYKIGKTVVPDVRLGAIRASMNVKSFTPAVKRVWLYETTSYTKQSALEVILLRTVEFPQLSFRELPDGHSESRITDVPVERMIGHCEFMAEYLPDFILTSKS